MIRLNMVVEGQTEEMFVNRVLKPHLAKHGVTAVPRLVFTGRRYGKTFRGGVTRYGNFKWDMVLWMREDKSADSHFTTMFDLYALPGDFPGQVKARGVRDPYQKVRILEKSMAHDIDDPRLIPYIQLHEFEALLLSAPQEFRGFFIEQGHRANDLESLVNSFQSPEYINSGELTAPSKRIIHFFPGYGRSKAVAGPFIASAIGVERMRERCPHFGEWLGKLEELGRD